MGFKPPGVPNIMVTSHVKIRRGFWKSSAKQGSWYITIEISLLSLITKKRVLVNIRYSLLTFGNPTSMHMVDSGSSKGYKVTLYNDRHPSHAWAPCCRLVQLLLCPLGCNCPYTHIGSCLPVNTPFVPLLKPSPSKKAIYNRNFVLGGVPNSALRV